MLNLIDKKININLSRLIVRAIVILIVVSPVLIIHPIEYLKSFAIKAGVFPHARRNQRNLCVKVRKVENH
jgi:hypothetical protein